MAALCDFNRLFKEVFGGERVEEGEEEEEEEDVEVAAIMLESFSRMFFPEQLSWRSKRLQKKQQDQGDQPSPN